MTVKLSLRKFWAPVIAPPLLPQPNRLRAKLSEKLIQYVNNTRYKIKPAKYKMNCGFAYDVCYQKAMGVELKRTRDDVVPILGLVIDFLGLRLTTSSTVTSSSFV